MRPAEKSDAPLICVGATIGWDGKPTHCFKRGGIGGGLVLPRFVSGPFDQDGWPLGTVGAHFPFKTGDRLPIADDEGAITGAWLRLQRARFAFARGLSGFRERLRSILGLR